MCPETPSYTQINTDGLPLFVLLHVVLKSIYSQSHRFSYRTGRAVEAYLILNPHGIICNSYKKVHSSQEY